MSDRQLKGRFKTGRKPKNRLGNRQPVFIFKSAVPVCAGEFRVLLINKKFVKLGRLNKTKFGRFL